ncbi:hypothetical protein [Gottfriedia acidiceleris]|uniref:hypothetical protein n=1 Tax=Gottfriedia acidiceleris TaxID=371036 RepID=UPI000B453D30|nr:hypothetical protein [Gottfriedia acidiceleris]
MEVLDILVIEEKRNKNESTHVLILFKGKFKYFISNDKNGDKYLNNALVSYSMKHNLFKYIMKLIPDKLKVKIGIAKYVKLSFNEAVSKEIALFNSLKSEKLNFNVLVGTYGKHQKLVLQLFDQGVINYHKIGTQNSSNQLINEIEFLDKYDNLIGQIMKLPKLISSEIKSKIFLMSTSEFNGKRVYPKFNRKIYLLFKDVTSIKEIKKDQNGVYMAFSHGDFAPWNMRKIDDKILLFDWEYCGFRFYGFDMIHYIYQIETLLNKREHEVALKIAIKSVKKYDGILNQMSDNLLTRLYEDEKRKIY